MREDDVFNMMTGLNQHVGNWPGKTVERKEGTITFNGNRYRLVDLPGTYSLSANSPEEVIARDYIITERPDVVIALINAASLKRLFISSLNCCHCRRRW